MKLYKALKIGYMNKDKQESKMGKRGYVRDNELSSGDHQAYFNKKTGKLLFNVAGTHNLNDVVTDGYLALGGLKSTNRYKEADKMLTKAKEKYKPTSTSVIGHSLGGSIAGLIASKSDDVKTLDKGATIGSRIRSNENAYRSSGDAVSLLNSGSKRMTTLANPSLGIVNTIKNGIVKQVVKNHDIDNIKNEKIFI
jgi:hypothetical protein